MFILPILIFLIILPIAEAESSNISRLCLLSLLRSPVGWRQTRKVPFSIELSEKLSKRSKMSNKSNSVRDQKPSKILKKQQQVTPEIMASAIDMEVLKKNSPLHNPGTSPRLHRALTKPRSTERGNCLCSPTTHAGSFKCRFHRSSGMIRGGSIGSNLSELDIGKSRAISDLV